MKTSKELFQFEKFDPSKQETLVSFSASNIWKDLRDSFLKNKSSLIGLILFAIIIILTIVIPLSSNYDRSITPISGIKNLSPGSKLPAGINNELYNSNFLFLFGTDKFGRDLWTRVWNGLANSILLGLVATTMNVIVGSILGLLMGYYNFANKYLLWVVKILSSLPIVLVLMLFNVTLGSSIYVMLLGLTATAWIAPSQQVRADVLVNKNLDFMIASKVLGTKNYKILSTFFLLSMPTIITQFIIIFPKMILFEATLGFLGLSTPDIPIIGNIINDGKSQMFLFPFQLFIPVGFLVFTVITMQMISSGIQDAFSLTKGGE